MSGSYAAHEWLVCCTRMRSVEHLNHSFVNTVLILVVHSKGSGANTNRYCPAHEQLWCGIRTIRVFDLMCSTVMITVLHTTQSCVHTTHSRAHTNQSCAEKFFTFILAYSCVAHEPVVCCFFRVVVIYD